MVLIRVQVTNPDRCMHYADIPLSVSDVCPIDILQRNKDQLAKKDFTVTV